MDPSSRKRGQPVQFSDDDAEFPNQCTARNFNDYETAAIQEAAAAGDPAAIERHQRAGKRCRNHAIHGSDPKLCKAHIDRDVLATMPRTEPKNPRVRCQAFKKPDPKTGVAEQCKNWAMRTLAVRTAHNGGGPTLEFCREHSRQAIGDILVDAAFDAAVWSKGAIADPNLHPGVKAKLAIALWDRTGNGPESTSHVNMEVAQKPWEKAYEEIIVDRTDPRAGPGRGDAARGDVVDGEVVEVLDLQQENARKARAALVAKKAAETGLTEAEVTADMETRREQLLGRLKASAAKEHAEAVAAAEEAAQKRAEDAIRDELAWNIEQLDMLRKRGREGKDPEREQSLRQEIARLSRAVRDIDAKNGIIHSSSMPSEVMSHVRDA